MYLITCKTEFYIYGRYLRIILETVRRGWHIHPYHSEEQRSTPPPLCYRRWIIFYHFNKMTWTSTVQQIQSPGQSHSTESHSTSFHTVQLSRIYFSLITKPKYKLSLTESNPTMHNSPIQPNASYCTSTSLTINNIFLKLCCFAYIFATDTFYW